MIKIIQCVGIILVIILTACTVGPDYVRPKVIVPIAYKEAPPGWKMATPMDDCERGAWWEVFNNLELNDLEKNIDISNQNVKAAYAQYLQAKALVAEARSAYFPILSGMVSVTREKSATSISSNSFNSSSSTVGGIGVSSPTNTSRPPFTDYNIELDASWTPDLWGSVRRNVEGSVAGVEASLAQLALTKLLAQASLAQYYFELRGLDADQKVLDETVLNYQKILTITQNQYKAGTASRAQILQVESLLDLAKVQAIDNGINRAVYEHAIAVLIGTPASLFCLAPRQIFATPPSVPLEIPSALLERRPDIAQAERLVAQANAQIGVAIAAYFPVLTLNGTEGFNSTIFSQWFSKPANFWSLGAQLADVIFDGGLRSAKVAAARASYLQTVAQYRQIVLAAFQDVEDNLATLRLLEKEIKEQRCAVEAAKKTLNIVMNEYAAGTLAFADILNAQITLFTAEKGFQDISYRQMVASVGLIRSLGGGWDQP